MKFNDNSPSYIIGILFLIFGGVLLLENLDIFQFRIFPIIFSYQTFILIIGLIIYLKSKDKTGIILIALGGFLLILKILHISISFWPVLLIAIGIYIIFSVKNRNSDTINIDQRANVIDPTGEYSINDIAVFGGVEKSFTSNNFKGGKATAIFGGCEIDLSNCELAPGKNVLEVLVMFGGVTLILPHNWKVVVEVTPIFGGFSDSRKRSLNIEVEDEKILVIRGLVIFGGGEVK